MTLWRWRRRPVPLAAAAVQAAIQRRHGRQGDALYEMLWRYDSPNRPLGELARLVEYLDYDDLAFRVVAFRNLSTGTRLTYGYRPEETIARRQAPTRKWREWALANAARGVEQEAALPGGPDDF